MKYFTLQLPLLFSLFFFETGSSVAQETVTFPSKDGVTITADKYVFKEEFPWMILCHQAGSSRGEFKDIAKRFHKLGYNCLAIDARSGNEINGVLNETAKDAKSKGKGTEYLDAEKDIIAAIQYIFNEYREPVTLVGSSYSASLVLKIAVGNPQVSRVIAYSPGEYFGKKLNVKDAIKKLDKPVYVASSADEKKGCEELVKDIVTGNKVVFAPAKEGKHGASALWKTNPGSSEYWLSLMMFLEKN